jgi:hypothetical protein
MSVDRGKSNLRDGNGVVHARAERIPFHVLVACDAADESVTEWVPQSNYTLTHDRVTCRKCKTALRRAGRAA